MLLDFIANCGGLLGLFVGFSFLSFVELIYYLIVRLPCSLRRTHNSNVVTILNKEALECVYWSLYL